VVLREKSEDQCFSQKGQSLLILSAYAPACQAMLASQAGKTAGNAAGNNAGLPVDEGAKPCYRLGDGGYASADFAEAGYRYPGFSRGAQ